MQRLDLELHDCAEELFSWYRSNSFIRFDEAITTEDDNSQAVLKQVYARLIDCMTYESLFCGNNYQTLSQYLASQMPKEDVDCFFQLLRDKQITEIQNHPAVMEITDADAQRRMCLEQLASHFIHWDALDLLNHVLADDRKEPEYSAITASKMLEMGRQFQILLFGRHIPDLDSFLAQYGYSKSIARQLNTLCMDEEWRYRERE